jgi:quinol monooxygenase YgiN/uncharacterized protein YunC (DUF1805 family)
MNTLVAKLKVKAGREGAALEVLRGLAREAAREPGALDYQVHRGEGGALVVYERFVDEAALDAHLRSEAVVAAMRRIEPLLTAPPELERCQRECGMLPRQLDMGGRPVEVHVVPLGAVNLVLARAPDGILACGAVDPGPLERFGIAAARVRPTRGSSVAGLEDLLAAEVSEANELARSRGLSPGMTGSEALRRL